MWYEAKLGPACIGTIQVTTPQFNKGNKYIAYPEADSHIVDGKFVEMFPEGHFGKYQQCGNDLDQLKAWVLSWFPPEVHPYIIWYECKK